MNQEWRESRALLWWMDCRCLFVIPSLRTDCAACAGPCLFQSVVNFSSFGFHTLDFTLRTSGYIHLDGPFFGRTPSMFGNVKPGFVLPNYPCWLRHVSQELQLILWKDMGKSSTNHGGFYLANMEGYWAIHNFFVPHIGWFMNVEAF